MIDYQTAKKRLEHRKDIILCEKEYVGWSKKALFFDFIKNKYFEAIPRNIVKYNSAHPDRGMEKRKQTNIEKYGVDNPAKSQMIQNKIKNTCIEKYGVTNPQQNKLIKIKTIKTLTKKHGIDNPAKLSSKRFIKETGEHLTDWYKNLPNNKNKPAYSTLIHNIKNKEINIETLNNFMETYKSSKTLLESNAEKLFDIVLFNKKLLIDDKQYRPDFKLSEDVYLNVDGLYWHSETIQKDNRYHFNMRKTFEIENKRIIQFREDEIRLKPHVCKSIVNNILGKTSYKIYARKCIVKIVPHKEAKVFIDNNHMMGSTTAKHVGLYYNNTIVSILSYKEKNNICKIERFCSLVDHSVVGGFSKLLSYLEQNCLKPTTTEIYNWVDLRYGTGDHLLNKEFVKRSKDELGWKWTDYTNTYNRLKCRANMDDRKLNQQQHADELGWFKIYDAGQRLYFKKLKG